ncbi:serine protease HtrA [Tissierella creatinophila]|nr:trypsin-like peptidase domain-containing protein [Tissierella creatinophila]
MNRGPRRGNASYIMVAIIAGIIGGILATYIAPNFLYGKLIPVPDIYKSSSNSNSGANIKIVPTDDIGVVSAVAKKAMNSVVGITTVVIQKEWFWERPMEGVGSGVIVDSDGYILTNSHVIGDGQAREIKVLFENGDNLDGKVLWFDKTLDLAVVKVKAKGLAPVELGDSEILEVGEVSVAIGNPLGLEFQRSVTSGVISGLHRSIKVDEFNIIEDLIQTDASINPGNSGGPLLNNRGEVIGINTAKIQTGEGLGFAIPINLVKPIISEIINKGSFNNVNIGFRGIEVEVYERQVGVDLEVDRGIVLLEIISGSPAQKAGLRQLDILSLVDGKEVDSIPSLKKILYKYKKGDKAVLNIIRDGKKKDVEIKF